MKYTKYLLLMMVLLGSLMTAKAQVSVGIGVGPVIVAPEPYCAWGYYPFYPYDCAPYGYYDPAWFRGGVFIGTGPWYQHRRWFGHDDDNWRDRNRWYGRPWHGPRPEGPRPMYNRPEPRYNRGFGGGGRHR